MNTAGSFLMTEKQFVGANEAEEQLIFWNID